MRMHIELDDELARQLDEVAGPRGRSAFVRSTLERAIAAELRAAALLSVAGSLRDSAHDWDDDPAEWVRAQRRSDPRRAG